MKNKLTYNLNTLIMLLPWLLIFSIFWLYPLLNAGYLSLTKYNTLSDTSQFVGFKNYADIFEDSTFWIALKNTIFFTVGTVPITLSLAILFAVILNSKSIKLKGIFRSVYFIPTVTSIVVIALIFTNLYAQDGYINFLLKMLKLPFPRNGWLLNTDTALPAIMIMDIWLSVGYYMVLVMAGLQTISDDLYDSAKLMGASSLRQFFKITLPLLKPTILFILVINTIKSFQIFIEIFVMTKGGPLNSTMTMVYYIFINAFEKSDALGYGSALAFVLFFLLLIFSFVQSQILKEKN